MNANLEDLRKQGEIAKALPSQQPLLIRGLEQSEFIHDLITSIQTHSLKVLNTSMVTSTQPFKGYSLTIVWSLSVNSSAIRTHKY